MFLPKHCLYSNSKNTKIIKNTRMRLFFLTSYPYRRIMPQTKT